MFILTRNIDLCLYRFFVLHPGVYLLIVRSNSTKCFVQFIILSFTIFTAASTISTHRSFAANLYYCLWHWGIWKSCVLAISDTLNFFRNTLFNFSFILAVWCNKRSSSIAPCSILFLASQRCSIAVQIIRMTTCPWALFFDLRDMLCKVCASNHFWLTLPLITWFHPIEACSMYVSWTSLWTGCVFKEMLGGGDTISMREYLSWVSYEEHIYSCFFRFLFHVSQCIDLFCSARWWVCFSGEGWKLSQWIIPCF